MCLSITCRAYVVTVTCRTVYITNNLQSSDECPIDPLTLRYDRILATCC